MMRGLRIKIAGATFVGVLVLIMAAVAWNTVDATTEATRWVQHTFEVRNTSLTIRSLILYAQVSERNYLLTGRLESLEDYRRTRARLPQELTKLRQLIRDNAKQADRVEELAPMIYLAITEVDGVLAIYAVAPERSLALLKGAAEGQTMLQVRRILDELDTEETTLLFARIARRDASFGLVRWTLAVGAILAFLTTMAVNISIWRDVSSRERAQGLLEDTNEALGRSNRDLDQFAYVASHDLKAPLRGIANLASWLEEDLDASLDAKSREHLHLLRGRVQRMEGLIDGILAYSRAGRKLEPPERVDVAALLRETAELLAPPEGVEIIVEPPMPVLRTTKVPLQQVWINLLGNAIKHGGSKIRCRARLDGRDWVFSVADNGKGIPVEYREKVFEIFQTLAPRDRVEGAGIGLAVVKKLVESRGGRVWVESEVGQGTTFHFRWREAWKGLGFPT
jgi:signal transduction histidine kinase